MDYQQRIGVVAGVRSGTPVVKGARVAVFDGLGYLSAETRESELLAEFPQLVHEDIKACLANAQQTRLDPSLNQSALCSR